MLKDMPANQKHDESYWQTLNEVTNLFYNSQCSSLKSVYATTTKIYVCKASKSPIYAELKSKLRISNKLERKKKSLSSYLWIRLLTKN
jgi:antitoxin component HigA of HigAB toxin-antitoxin module